MASDRARCYFCGKFVAMSKWFTNWKLIQAPGVADPEPYEIIWCNGCAQHARSMRGDSEAPSLRSGAMSGD